MSAQPDEGETTSLVSATKPRLLFLCTHNANRSQLAEALAGKLFGENVMVASAGSHPAEKVNPKAIAVLKEIGIDWSKSIPKSMSEIFPNDVASIDYVVTLCSNDGDGCPWVRGRRVLNYLHHIFDDPSALPSEGADGLDHYRRVRDEIYEYLKSLPLPQCQQQDAEENQAESNEAGISFFEKYLTVWVLSCMIVGGLIGYFQPSIVDSLKQAEIYKVSIPIAVLLWVMIFPMLLQIDFQSVYSAIANPGPIVLTTLVNFGIQPFTMYIVSLIFFRYIYRDIMAKELADEYLAGCILLGGAPCTAMVFVWSVLVGGDPGYTIVQVAVNDAMMLVLYLPTMLLLLEASSIPLPYETIAISVAFFIAIPLFLAILLRTFLLKTGGKPRLDSVIELLKPVCPIGLLATLVLIFIYQGETIGNKPIHILLIIIPLSIQTFAIFGLTFFLGYMVCMDFTVLSPAALISTSNFFELAVAIAISLYGPQSGASLATVVGVLVEVPTMLCLVQLCKRWQAMIVKRCEECDDKCPQLRKLANCNRVSGGVGSVTTPSRRTTGSPCCPGNEQHLCSLPEPDQPQSSTSKSTELVAVSTV